MRENADVLDQLPEVRDRLSNLVFAHDGMERVTASPLGQIAQRSGREARHQRAVSRPSRRAMVRSRARCRRSCATTRGPPRCWRAYYLESTFNAATAEKRGLPAQYGGSIFVSAVSKHPQRYRNLLEVMKALPEGETRWKALDGLLTTLKATAYRPQKGSDTAFNHAIQKEFASGKTHVGQVVSDALTGAAAGDDRGRREGRHRRRRGGLKPTGWRRDDADPVAELRRGRGAPHVRSERRSLDLRALAKSPPGSKNAELFTSRLLSLRERRCFAGAPASRAVEAGRRREPRER